MISTDSIYGDPTTGNAVRGLLRYHLEHRLSRDINSVPETPAQHRVTGSLRRLGVPEEAIHLLSAVPVIQVAWVDGRPRSDQSTEILNAVSQHGLRPGMIIWKLLESWLKARPDASMFGVWCDYVGALRWIMTTEEYAALAEISIARAQATADAMRPLFGLSGVSQQHDYAVQQIAQVFESQDGS